MRWHIGLVLALLTLGMAAASPGQDKSGGKGDDSYIKVEAKGKLQTGVMAIGGETTGVILQTRDGTVELELGKNKKLMAEADKLNGKTVVVTGTLTLRKGVERGQRTIVTVTTLKEADGKAK